MNSPFPIVDVGKISLQRESSEIDRRSLETVAELLKNSFCEFGACYFTNHGIQHNDEFMKIVETFFKQPLEVKKQHLRGTRRDFGYTPVGQERPNHERPGDFKEAFNFQPADDPNDWTDKTFPSACRELYSQCEIFGYRVLDALSIALGQNQTFLRDRHKMIGTRDNPTTLRTLYYPPVVDVNLEPDQIRLSEHSDYGSISFLFQDDVGGLEADLKGKGFIQVTPIPGTILVISAELLGRWTADKVPALVHRVMIPVDEKKKGLCRQSTVFFMLPDHDCLVKPMDGSTKYKPITCKDYLEKKMLDLAGVKY